MMTAVRRAVRRGFYRLPLPLRRQAFYLYYQRRPGHFRRPVLFTEKVNWRILNDRRPVLGWTCDKLRVKEEARRHGVRVPHTYWQGTDVGDLARLELPNHWVLKPNHRTALVHFGRGAVTDIDELRRVTAGWLDDHEGESMGEWAYSQARPLLLVEEMLGDGTVAPSDYRFFTFGGRVKLVQMESDTYTRHTRRFYTADWRPLAATQVYPLAEPVARPDRFDEMLAAAEAIGTPFDFVRVDLYNIDGQIFLGEVTPYPTGGLGRFRPRSFDAELGAHWTLPAL
jgi:hypothetical protein